MSGDDPRAAAPAAGGVGRPSGQLHRVALGSQQLDLPVVPVTDDVAIALLVLPDHGVAVLERAGADLAALLAPSAPTVVAGTATMGVPVAAEVARALGVDDWVVLQKTRKAHLTDAFTEPLHSITTSGQQQLMLDRARAGGLAGARVALVDDVVSTGSSLVASLRLLRAAGAEVVAVGVLLCEGDAWREELGADAALVRALGELPLFAPAAPAGRADPADPAGRADGAVAWAPVEPGQPRPVNRSIEE